MFSFFKKKDPIPVLSEVPTLQGAGVVRLGVGKWVVHANKVGIIASTTGYPIVEVHYVDDTGATTLAVFVPMDSVRIARLLEIPENRRPTDAAYAAAYLGYV